MVAPQEITNAKILIVEDEALIGLDLKVRLSNLGYTVMDHTFSGEKALELIERNPPDLVLMDIVLQGKADGIEAADIIRTRWGIPVVFTTAYADRERIKQARLAYPFGYLMKPYQDRDIEVTIEMALFAAKVDKERRNSEEALRESEEKYRRLIEKAPVGFYQINLTTGKMLQVNDVMIVYTGYSREELLNMTPFNLLAPQSQTVFLERLKKISNNEDVPCSVDYQIRTKNGNLIWVECDNSFFKSEAQWISNVICRDITERKRALEELAKSENKYHSLFEGAMDMIHLVDENGRIMDANRIELETLGYTKEELIGKSLLDIIDPEYREVTGKTFQLVRKGEKITRYETMFRKRSGEKLPVEVSVVPELADGKVVSARAIIRDISERKQTEEALRKSEEHFKKLVDISPFAICVTDPSGRLTFASPKTYELFNSSVDVSSQGKSVLEWVHPDYKDIAIERFRKLIAKEIPSSFYEYKLLKQDGSIFWGEISSTLLTDSHGRIFGLMSAIHDITDRKKTEEALLVNEEKYKVLLEESTDPIFSFEAGGRYLYVNKAFARGVGKDQSEIIGKTIWDVFPKEEADKRFAALDRTFKTGEGKTIEVRVPRPEGDQYYLTTITPIKSEKGEVLSAICSSKNMTDRKRTEEALWKSEERYRNLVEESFDGIFFQRGTKIIFANRGLYKMLGYPDGELEGTDHWLVYHPDYQEITRQRAQARLRGEKPPSQYEVKLQRKDGTSFDGEVRARVIKIGEESGIQVWVRDITERKQAEEVTKNNETRWAALYELSQMSSDSEKEMTDFALEKAIELTGSTIGYLAFLNPEETILSMHSWSQAAMRECTIENKPIEYMVNKTGLWGEAVRQRRPVITNDYPADNPLKKGYPGGHVQVQRHMNIPLFDGEKIVIVAGVGNKKEPYNEDDVRQLTMMMDGMWKILKSNRAEEALRESEKRYRTIFEESNDGIALLKGDKHIYVNQKMVEIFGYDRAEDITSRPLAYLIAPEDRQRVKDINFRRQKGKKVPEKYEFKGLRRDGKAVFIEVSATKTFYQGENVTLVFLRDITESKQAKEEKRKLEEQLQRAEKMEALGTLAGGVAHDLNNVLGIMVGYAEILLYDLEESSPLRPALNNIMGGSQKAAAIVQDMLTLARRGVAHRKVLNLNQIVLECQDSSEFEKLSSYNPSLKIKIDLEPDLLNISGSSVHLGKALFNLLSNASEAMPKGGELIIKTSNQYLDRPVQGYDEIREGDYVVLSVTDTGEGISAGDLKRIFEPFYTKKVMGRSGTGLGLAVVWGTVKDHNGYINVQSEEEKGSTFTLYFPVTREAVTAEETAVSIHEFMGKGESILVVDDVQGQRDLAKEMLRKLNYQVTSVSSGEEAVAYLKEHCVDLLVLDMIMDPGMDGLDTYKKILEIRPGQKAIIVSGFSESDRVHSAQTLGAGAYVKKPYVLEKLGLAVRKELDKGH